MFSGFSIEVPRGACLHHPRGGWSCREERSEACMGSKPEWVEGATRQVCRIVDASQWTCRGSSPLVYHHVKPRYGASDLFRQGQASSRQAVGAMWIHSSAKESPPVVEGDHQHHRVPGDPLIRVRAGDCHHAAKCVVQLALARLMAANSTRAAQPDGNGSSDGAAAACAHTRPSRVREKRAGE